MGSIPELFFIFSALHKLQKKIFLYFSSSTGTYKYKNGKKLKTFYRYHNNSAIRVSSRIVNTAKGKYIPSNIKRESHMIYTKLI